MTTTTDDPRVAEAERVFAAHGVAAEVKALGFRYVALDLDVDAAG